jgi:precorrin-6B methylase 2
VIKRYVYDLTRPDGWCVRKTGSAPAIFNAAMRCAKALVLQLQPQALEEQLADRQQQRQPRRSILRVANSDSSSLHVARSRGDDAVAA